MDNWCICWFFTHTLTNNNEMYNSGIKIRSQFLVRQRWAEGYNSGVKGLMHPENKVTAGSNSAKVTAGSNSAKVTAGSNSTKVTAGSHSAKVTAGSNSTKA
jgi:hypothetical protein